LAAIRAEFAGQQTSPGGTDFSNSANSFYIAMF
jgi:hypothetical protein